MESLRGAKTHRLPQRASLRRIKLCFKNAVSRCRALGLNLEYENLRYIFETAVLKGREENLLLRKGMKDANNAFGELLVRYLANVTEHLLGLYEQKDGCFR